MARSVSKLVGPAAFATAADTSILAAPAAGTVYLIRQIHINNGDTVAHTFTISIGTDAAGTRIFKDLSVAAKSTYDWNCYLPLTNADTNGLRGNVDSGTTSTYTVTGDTITAG